MGCKPTYKGKRYESLNDVLQNTDLEYKAKHLYSRYLYTTKEPSIEGFTKFLNERYAQYSRIPGWTSTEVYQFVDDMFVRIQSKVAADKRNYFNLPSVLSGVFSPEEGRNMFQAIREDVYTEMDDDVWNALVDVAKDRMKAVLGIEFLTDEHEDVDEDNKNMVDYTRDQFDINPQSTLPSPLKFILMTTPASKPKKQSEMYIEQANVQRVEQENSYTDGMVKLANFKRLFAVLMDKLGNTSDVDELRIKLINLLNNDSDFVRIFFKIGGTTGKNFDFENFTIYDWALFINFYQTFTRQRPTSLVQFVDDTDTVKVGDADVFSSVKKIMSTWFNNLKLKAASDSDVITFDSRTKMYIVKKGVLDRPSPSNRDAAVAFLNDIGIPFTTTMYDALGSDIERFEHVSRQAKFLDDVSTIYYILKKNPTVARVDDEQLGISGRVKSLAALMVYASNPIADSTRLNAENKRKATNVENNYPSLFENMFNESETKKELLEKRPELNDPFTTSSVVLKEGGAFYHEDGSLKAEMKIGISDGERNVSKDKGYSTSSLQEHQRISVDMNNNLNGWWNILIPGDSASQWMIKFGELVNRNSVLSGNMSEVLSVFTLYLHDEIALAKDYERRSGIKNLRGRAKHLRFMKEILDKVLVNTIEEMIDSDASYDDIIKYISEAEVKKQVEESFTSFLTASRDRFKNYMMENGELIVKDGRYAIPGIEDSMAKDMRMDKFSMTDGQVDGLISYLTATQIIANTEMHKILFGDPYQFSKKGENLDETKRIKSFLTPRKILFSHPEYDIFLNNELNKVDDIPLEDGEVGRYLFKDHLVSALIEEVIVPTETYPEDNKEGDAFSILSPMAFRHIALKTADWSDEAELFHQWHMAWERQNRPGYEYKSDALKKRDKEFLATTPEPDFKVKVLKPLVSGNEHDINYINVVLDKTSMMPIYYKMVKGKAFEALYLKMQSGEIDYLIYPSGRKVGATTPYPVYINGTEINPNPIGEASIVKIPASSFGIVLETSYQEGKKQTVGTQSREMSTMDLFEQGRPLSPKIQETYNKYIKSLNDLFRNGYERLLAKLGITDTGAGNYVIEDFSLLEKGIKSQVLSVSFTDNVRDTLSIDKETGRFKMAFEASNQYHRIRNILYSMVTSSVSSYKMNGKPYVQVPVTFWEDAKEGRGMVHRIKGEDGKVSFKKINKEEYDALSDNEKKNVFPASDTLSFYVDEFGRRVCEVMLPHWFKNKFDKKKFPTDESILAYLEKNEPEILKGIGFRIPTQAMSSIEIFKVKAFLPQYMGDTIVVPSQIVAKAGSDFDIDKLNTYLKNVYVDENGNVKLVRYYDTEEKTKDFYKRVYERTKQNKIAQLTKQKNFQNTILSILTKLKHFPEGELGKESTALTDREVGFYEKYQDVLYDIMEQAYEKDMIPSEYVQDILVGIESKNIQVYLDSLNERMKSEFIEDHYRKALENRYFEAFEEIVTLPENYQMLTSPVDKANLDEVAKEIDSLVGNRDEEIGAKLLDRTYVTKLRHAYLMTKKWVGIGAVNGKSHSQFQKANIALDITRVKLPKQDAKFIGDGKVHLPHNTTEDGKVSLSGRMTKNGKEYISKRLSGYITAFVDAINDPYIAKIIIHNKAVSVLLMLERMGVGETAAFFLNQPIIREHLKEMSKQGTNNIYSQSIISSTITKFGGMLFDVNKELLSFTEGELDLRILKNNINEYYAERRTDVKFSREYLRTQQRILYEFLKYAKMSDHLFHVTQVTNFDTTRFRNSGTFFRKANKLKDVMKNNIFCCVQDVIDNTYLGGIKENLEKGMDSLGSTMKTEQKEYITLLNSALKPYAENTWLGNDDFDKVFNKMKSSFLDYVIQTKSGITKRLEELAVEPSTSIVAKLERAKETHPHLAILKMLYNSMQGTYNPKEATKSIRLLTGVDLAIDEHQLMDMMYELKDELPELYDDIVTVAIIQGTHQSAISIKSIIPVNDYAAKIQKHIDELTLTGEIEDFVKNNWFQRANWKDETIVPSIQWNWSPFEELYIGQTEYEEELFLYEYGGVRFRTLPVKEGEPTNSIASIIAISPNSFGTPLSYDVIKTRVIVPYRRGSGEMVNIFTRQTMPKSGYIKAKQANRDDVFLTYGYKKVTYPDGSPALTKNGDYIYKLINLYGDGQYATEYYSFPTPSKLNNLTFKTERELTDAEIINSLNLVSQQQEEVETFIKSLPQENLVEENVNIYYGTNENADLSNFAIRPFEDKTEWQGLTFKSVEGAFQAAKIQLSDMYDKNDNLTKEGEALLDKLQEASGAEAKALGRKVTGLNTREWDRLSSHIMKGLLLESFKQNPKALEKLLATGNAELTHIQDKGKWGKEFPRLLMEVRDELRGQSFKQEDDFLSAAAEIQKSLEQKQQEKEEQMEIVLPNTTSYKYYGALYTIMLNEDGVGIDVVGYAGKNVNKQKLLDNFNTNPFVDPQTKQTVEAPVVEEGKPSILDVRTTPLSYTEGQKKALLDVQDLINSGKQHYYLLAGYAGTGKTTIAENIIKYGAMKGKSPIVLAPTNKAAKVLNDKLSETGIASDATTIHKAIYGEPDLQGNWVPSRDLRNSIILIDESSMISKDVMTDLIDATNNKNNIVVFMGDGFQLEQIGESSKLFESLEKPEEFNVAYGGSLSGGTTLTEVKRQSLDSNVLKVATLGRIENQSFILTESVEDFTVVKSKKEFVDSFKESIRNNEDSIMIVATNDERIAMNNVARKEKFGEEKKMLNNGEVLISVANSSMFSNSETFKITSSDALTKKTISFTDKYGNVNSYDVFFTNATTSEDNNIVLAHVPLLDKPSLYHQQIMKVAYEDKSLMDLLDGMGLLIETRRGVKLSKQLVIATYGYAITGHKSQGSQWNKVFVNQNFVAPTWNKARWYYTAITRSAKDVIVYNSGNNTAISYGELNRRLNDKIAPDVTFNSISEFSPERKQEIITNFANKHFKGNKENALKHINNALQKEEIRQEVIQKLKDCY